MKKVAIPKAMMLIALMCVSFAFVSCEEVIFNGPNTYLIGFAEADVEVKFSERNTIQNAFIDELKSSGISIAPNSSSFTMEGNALECESKIIAACKRGEDKLKEVAYEKTYVWHVVRYRSEDDMTEIYRYNVRNIESRNPKTVVFGYQNSETEDLLEFCNIVMEYSDGNETKVDTITTKLWDKIFTTELPCTYTFKKTYTLKADKDMASADSIRWVNNSHAYVYKYFDAERESFGYTEVDKIDYIKSTTKCKDFAEKQIERGVLNAVNTFEFGENGNLKVSHKK